jgi:pimeloyl-ACP methyl ester carboxylesterase
MALDTSSFPAYLRSLDLSCPVTTRPGRLIAGPPLPVLDVALRLGCGGLLFDQQRARALIEWLGLEHGVLKELGARLRHRAMWRPVLEDLARPHIHEAGLLAGRGDRASAGQRIKAALTLLYLAVTGDGYYFFTPMRERGRMLYVTRRLYKWLNTLSQNETQRIRLGRGVGRTTGLLHLPRTRGRGKLPALVAFHPLGSDKEAFDAGLALFREAGYATLCVDLPAHGENFYGPRLTPNSEWVGLAALEALARHPAVDEKRLGVMGGSLGALFAQRTAAASRRVKACLAYASPFDLGYRLEETLPGLADCFGWVVGVDEPSRLRATAQQFHLRDVVERIECPVCVVHGTQDHICDFTRSYEIASRLKAPVTVRPLIGVDHEAAVPATPELAGPGVAWLQQVL